VRKFNFTLGVGYLGGVTASAVSHGLFTLAYGLMTGGGDATAMSARALQLMGASAAIALLYWIAALVLALPSVAVTYYIAKKFQIRRLAYYFICGCIASIAYLPLVYALLAGFAGGHIPLTEDPSVRSGRIWILFGSPCIIGAMVFWAIAGRTLPARGDMN
jgi:hypothetical protein